MADVNSTTSFNPVFTAGVSAGSNLLGTVITNKYNERQAELQRDWNEQMMNKQNAFSLDMWNKTNAYNSPSAQVQRLRDAGLNPLFYGLDGSSANSFQSAQALGYDRSSMSPMSNPVSSGLDAYTQMKSLQKDIELKDAQIDKLSADSSSVKLDNEFKDKTMDARVESVNLGNSLTKENIEKVKSEKSQIEANIRKTIAETENEFARKLLIDAQTNVAKAQEKEIIELLPYKKLLSEAQTEAQKAAAASAWLKAAIDKNLIDGGYVDSLIDKYSADAKGSAALANINEFKSSVKTGNVFTINDDDSVVIDSMKKFVNGVFATVGTVSEAILGPISGILQSSIK